MADIVWMITWFGYLCGAVMFIKYLFYRHVRNHPKESVIKQMNNDSFMFTMRKGND